MSSRSACVDGASPSAPASAWDWIPGTSPRWLRTGRSSSCSPAKARSDSASTPVADSTAIGAARCLAYSSSADLPIPGSPRTTSDPPALARASSSNRSAAAHSASRPTSCNACGSAAPAIARMITGTAADAQREEAASPGLLDTAAQDPDEGPARLHHQPRRRHTRGPVTRERKLSGDAPSAVQLPRSRNRGIGRISRDGRDQRLSRSATGVPDPQRTERVRHG
jgi:hypothetical protein